MSALAVYLERLGLTTVVIGLIKEHLQKTRPPRSLWVPFELGRPLGGWFNKGEFQLDVLRDALSLLERDKDAARDIKDYPLEDPTEKPDTDWQPPLSKMNSLTEEFEQLEPVWKQRVEFAAGTATGVSSMSVSDGINMLEKLNTESANFNPFPQREGGFYRIKLIADDIKTYYIEAALASGRPNSDQIGRWFWHDSRAGSILRHLRENNLGSDDKPRQFVCSRLLVPGKWL